MRAMKAKPIVTCGIPSVAMASNVYGAEKTKCRRKAVPPTTISKVCRLKKVGKDAETGQKLCIYSAQGRGDSEVTVPVSPSLNCQRTYSCKKDD